MSGIKEYCIEIGFDVCKLGEKEIRAKREKKNSRSTTVVGDRGVRPTGSHNQEDRSLGIIGIVCGCTQHVHAQDLSWKREEPTASSVVDHGELIMISPAGLGA